MDKPPFPPICVDHANDTVTFALSFEWDRPWAMDHCEVGYLGRRIREILVDGLRADPSVMVRALIALETWEPNEERHIGKLYTNIPLTSTPDGEVVNESPQATAD